MKLDLRDRCRRPKCRAIIRKGKMAQASWTRYKPYCSYQCQEWHRLEAVQEFLNEQHANDRSERVKRNQW